MVMVTVQEAESDFGKLLQQAKSGEDIIIAEGGYPVAKLTAVAVPGRRRVAGSARGLVTIKPDFDAPLPEDVLEAFEQ